MSFFQNEKKKADVSRVIPQTDVAVVYEECGILDY